jgi:hypothetical protein
MPDESWRTSERLWQANPGDQDALARAIVARRRAGLPVPAWMLERRVHPARAFESAHALDVFALLPDGRAQGLGRTPGAVQVPAHRALWVQPDAPTDAALAELAEDDELARALPGLALAPDVTNAGLSALARFPALARLDLAGCTRVTAAGLAHVGALPALDTLDLWSATRIDDAALEPLAALGGLVTLNLRRCAKVTARGLARLARLEALAVLSLGGCAKVTDAGIDALGPLPQLTALDLSSCPITDRGLASLGALPELTLLNLSFTAITPAGLERLAPLEKLAQLYVLGCGEATRRAEKVIGKLLPRCEVVAAIAAAGA